VTYIVYISILLCEGNMQEFPGDLSELNPEDIVDRHVIEPPTITNENSIVRRVALQILYEIDSAKHKIGAVIQGQLQYNPVSASGAAYLREIVSGVMETKDQLDALIKKYAPEWPVDQLAIVDRNVLRLAIYELTMSEDVPIRVVIDEAVELGKWFGAEGSARFINGVLGAISLGNKAIADQLEPED
jgi:transcription antitermination protein NusB